MDAEEFELHEKHNAALHEAAHLTAVLAQGRRGRAWINRNEQEGVEWKTWIGKCECIGGMTAVISIAGFVAVCVADGLEEPHDMIDLLEWDANAISETDRADIPDDREGQFLAIESALSMLRKHVAFHQWATAELESDGAITDHEADEAWRRLESGKPTAQNRS